MLELEVILGFACCACGDPTGVTVRCAGASLGSGKSPVASVRIPCPNCQSINQVIFAPDDGAVLHVVAADKPRYLIPEPSYN